MHWHFYFLHLVALGAHFLSTCLILFVNCCNFVCSKLVLAQFGILSSFPRTCPLSTTSGWCVVSLPSPPVCLSLLFGKQSPLLCLKLFCGPMSFSQSVCPPSLGVFHCVPPFTSAVCLSLELGVLFCVLLCPTPLGCLVLFQIVCFPPVLVCLPSVWVSFLVWRAVSPPSPSNYSAYPSWGVPWGRSK